MQLLRCALAVSLLLTISSLAANGADSTKKDPATLRVGAAAAEIEADDSMVIAGGIGGGRVQGQEGKLRAVAVVLEKHGSGKLAIVACDVLFVTRELMDPIAEEIEKTCGIPVDHILINATHTHHAPSTTKIHGYDADPLFCKRLQRAVVKAVQDANAKLKGDAKFYFRLGEESSVGQNSRLLLKDNTIFWTGTFEDAVRPTGPFDPELPVLAFRGSGGDLKALIFNHSTHTIGARKPGVRSPAFYGLAAQELEAELGGTVCFLEGASGSTHNLKLSPDEMTIRIKNAVRDALDQAEPRPVTKLAGIKRKFNYRVRRFDEAKEEQTVSAYCKKRMPADWADKTTGIFRVMRQELSPHQGEERTTWVQTLLVGDVAIVGVPAEFFTKLGQDIKRRSPFRYTYVAELANDWIGYLPDKKAHELGGYQTWTGHHSLAEPGTGEAVVEQAVRMLRELKKQ